MAENTGWRKSSFCNADQPMCVEVGKTADGVVVRDANGKRVAYTREEFRAFLDGVKAGEFDDLA